MPVRTLSARNLRSLPAVDGRRTDYRDTVVRALVLRVSPRGSRVWLVTYKRRGRRGSTRRYKVGDLKTMDLAQARQAAREVLNRVFRGEDPQAERNEVRRQAARPEGLTVAELLRRYLEAARIRPSTRKEWVRLAGAELQPAPLGLTLAAQLTRADIREMGRRIVARPAPYTANRAFGLLRAAFTWGVQEDLLTGSPFVGLRKPADERRSGRILELPELRALVRALRHLEGHYVEATWLLLLTAARRSMVMGATREEFQGLEGEAPTWVIGPERAGTKRRERAEAPQPHVVPLSSDAAAVVRARLQAIGARQRYLFPQVRLRRRGERRRQETSWWSSRFVRDLRLAMVEMLTGTPVDRESAKAVAEALERVPRWTIHNLRHTVATMMREHLRVTSEVVGLLLAHTPSRSATTIYDRAELLDQRRAALVSWAAWLRRLEAGEVQPGKVLPMAPRD